MIKDKFEIEIGKRLRTTQAEVPVGSWDAIRAGIKSPAGLPVQNAAPFSNAGFVVGIIVGAAMFISLALYSGHENVRRYSVEQGVELLKPETVTERKSPVTVVQKENETPASASVEVVEKSELVNDSPQAATEKSEVQNNSNSEVATREVLTFEPISANTDAEIDSRNSEKQSARKLASRSSAKEGKAATQSPNVPAPKAQIMADRISGYAPLTVHFDNKGQGERYYWEFGYMTESFDKAPEVIFDEPGIYTVYLSVENEEGEIAEDYVQITVKEGSKFYIQNTFTPNGDGKNDTYKISGALNISEFYMVITDQNDKKVFESRDINREWNFDQAVHGQVGAMYFVTYRAVGIDGKVYSGNRTALNIRY
ncbi:hypothetical protein G3O08_11255 [Cryomorpha ignava]|uniref:PKD domain-containing protein n=1 Tax=Cryomorpha ignava TaxID=101383 RepID=A0A7K3WQX3_9FLAO|nr:gliding motility-associated C-terminal domain-containing protein [Cryomorpha ignava]NEN24077.1 hypothetical protein [Cryomorpha ignava]